MVFGIEGLKQTDGFIVGLIGPAVRSKQIKKKSGKQV